MNHTIVREINLGASAYAKSPNSTFTSKSLIATLLLLFGILSISGCAGVTSAPKSSNQTQNTPTAPTTPASATISVSPASITFGSVAIGGTVSQSVTLSNGGGSDLTVTQASTEASGFTIIGAAFPMTIAAGSQATINIAFSPKAAGAVSGAVSVISSASTSPTGVTVSGAGVAATTLLNSSAASLSFGSVTTGNSSTQGVTLSNAGNSNITVSSISLAGTGVTTSGVSAGLILAPGQSAILDVIYSPLVAGSLAGSVTVVSNATNSPDSISLSGTGVQPAVSHSVTLMWAASTSTVAGYNVYRSNASAGPYTEQNSSIVAATSYMDSTVQAGQTYYYEVTSVTSSGVESSDSTNASATIPTS